MAAVDTGTADAVAAELRALAQILDELDYYELLEVPRQAHAGALRSAYHARARSFHPDRHRGADAQTLAAAERIAKRVAEAYAVLRDPRRRKLYDEQLGSADRTGRLRLVEGEQQAERRVRDERQGRTPNGRRFVTLAQSDLGRGDVEAAARNLQMALTFEPDNDFFREQLEQVRSQLGYRKRR